MRHVLDFILIIFDHLINFVISLPRYPILYILDSIACCYLIRSIKFRNPLYSFTISLIMTSFPDSLYSYLTRSTIEVLTNPYIVPIHLLIWLIFNFSPFDFVYRTFKKLSILTAIIIGLKEGSDVTLGVQIANSQYQFWIYKIIFAVIFASIKFIILSFFQRCMQQRVKSPGPIFFVSTICAIFYYSTIAIQNGEFDINIKIDSRHKFNLKKFFSSISQETLSFITIFFACQLTIIRHYVKDEYYSRMWHKFENVIGSCIPYYGKTWIVPQQETTNIIQDNNSRSNSEPMVDDSSNNLKTKSENISFSSSSSDSAYSQASFYDTYKK